MVKRSIQVLRTSALSASNASNIQKSEKGADVPFCQYGGPYILPCDSHQNPELILLYLTVNIWKINHYAIATSVHRQIVDGFVI
jgi:hypothetical protein